MTESPDLPIGAIGEHPVMISKSTLTIFCKGQMAPTNDVIKAIKSSFDRINVKDDLLMEKGDFMITLGCLKFTKDQANSLIKNIMYVRNSN